MRITTLDNVNDDNYHFFKLWIICSCTEFAFTAQAHFILKCDGRHTTPIIFSETKRTMIGKIYDVSIFKNIFHKNDIKLEPGICQISKAFKK